MNFQMFKLVLEKAEEPEIKLPTSSGSKEKQEGSRKTSISALLTRPTFDWVDHNKLENSRDGNARPPDLPLEKFLCRSGSNIRTGHGTTDWFQIGKGVCQSCILSPCLFNIYAETLDWMKHKLESRLPGEISISSDMQMTPPLWQKVKRNSKVS